MAKDQFYSPFSSPTSPRTMSLQWTLIAGFLYAEIGLILLLLLPFISPKTWNKLFKSRFLKGVESQLIYYFYVLVAILVLFFLDAIREMRKYGDEQHAADSAPGGHGATHLDAQMQMHMRLFRAQRNFYISGFALFLCLVIQRLVALLSANATVQAEREAAMKQAASASRAAEALLDDKSPVDGAAGKDLKKELEEAKKELSKALKDKESMKAQAENLSKEYDRLTDEYNKIERKLKIQGDGDKKDD